MTQPDIATADPLQPAADVGWRVIASAPFGEPIQIPLQPPPTEQGDDD